MKMKKLFASLLATSIVAAGASAFAAPVANDAGFDKEAGTYSIAADLSAYGTDQMTILIIPEAAYNAGEINDADILYIDQAAANTENIFANVGILGGTELADGNYYVKIGGENIAKDGIIVEKFTVTTTPEGIEVQLGDANQYDNVEILDVLAILDHLAGVEGKTLTGISAFAADANQYDNIEILDVLAVLDHLAGVEGATLGKAIYVAE